MGTERLGQRDAFWLRKALRKGTSKACGQQSRSTLPGQRGMQLKKAGRASLPGMQEPTYSAVFIDPNSAEENFPRAPLSPTLHCNL